MTAFAHHLVSITAVLIVFTSGILCVANGTTVQDSFKFPFTATFLTPALCGGTFISLNPPWILTAAHCLEGYGTYPETSPNKDAIGYGNVHILRQKRASITRAIPHPLYQRLKRTNDSSARMMHYDIGLVQLSQPIEPSPFVDRIALWPSITQISDSDYFTLGMGYTSLDGPQAELLQEAQCTRVPSDHPATKEVQGKVVVTTSSAMLCHGDSGSALLTQQVNSFYLVGVLNRILDVHDPNLSDPTCPVLDRNDAPAYNVFANAANHLKWIANVTGLPVEQLTAPPFTHAGSRVGYDISLATSSAVLNMMLLGLMFCCYILVNLL